MSVSGPIVFVNEAIDCINARIAYCNDISTIMEGQTKEENNEYFAEIAPSLSRLCVESDTNFLSKDYSAALKKDLDLLREMKYDLVAIKVAFANPTFPFEYEARTTKKYCAEKEREKFKNAETLAMHLHCYLKSQNAYYEGHQPVSDHALYKIWKKTIDELKTKKQKKDFKKETKHYKYESKILFTESDLFYTIQNLLERFLLEVEPLFKRVNASINIEYDLESNQWSLQTRLTKGPHYKKCYALAKKLLDKYGKIKRLNPEFAKGLEEGMNEVKYHIRILVKSAQRFINQVSPMVPSYVLDVWAFTVFLDGVLETITLKNDEFDVLLAAQKAQSNKLHQTSNKAVEPNATRSATKDHKEPFESSILSEPVPPAVEDDPRELLNQIIKHFPVKEKSKKAPKATKDDPIAIKESKTKKQDDNDSMALDQSDCALLRKADTVKIKLTEACASFNTTCLEGEEQSIQTRPKPVLTSSPSQAIYSSQKSQTSHDKDNDYDEIRQKLSKNKDKFAKLFSKNISKAFTLRELTKFVIDAGGTVDGSKAGSRIKITLKSHRLDMVSTVRQTIHATHAKGLKSEKHASSTTVKLIRGMFEKAGITSAILWPPCSENVLDVQKHKRK